jgi:serine/threonine protein kinase
MIYGRTPWSAESEKQLGSIIEKVPVRFPSEIPVSEMSKDFIKKCLTVDENNRIDA